MNASLRHIAILAALLTGASCSSQGTRMPDPSRAGIGPILETAHRGADDLLSAGLGIDGLRLSVPPPVADPAAPTAVELRRRAIWANWRGIADLRPGGGAGDDLPSVPGREFSAVATLPDTRGTHRVLVQLPDAFAPDRPCLVVAPASGSRGVYGAIAVAASWAFRHGCAVVYTDKGAGTDYFDLDAGTGPRLDGSPAGPDEAAVFVPPPWPDARGVAFKHAHSQENPEADWGRHVLQAARFGLDVLAGAFPGHGITPEKTRILAVGISNGGGAVLRAAGEDDGLLDAVVAGEPNVHVDAAGARPLYDYATLAALYMPCALLDLDDLPQPPAGEAMQALGRRRCASLAEHGLLKSRDAAGRAREARALLEAAGFDEVALRSGATSTGFDLWRSVAAAYASAYGRFPIGAHPCGYGYAVLDAQGRPRPAGPAERVLWWSDASGIPPGQGIVLVDPLRAGLDPDLPGLLCLRGLWDGDGADAVRVRQGIAATRAMPPRPGLPVRLVHGRDDGLIPPVFSSLPYVAAAQAVGADVTVRLVPDAQHFDAFLALPDYAARYVPLLPRVHAALDEAWDAL